jgi:hypothetical protein
VFPHFPAPGQTTFQVITYDVSIKEPGRESVEEECGAMLSNDIAYLTSESHIAQEQHLGFVPIIGAVIPAAFNGPVTHIVLTSQI